MTSVNILLPIAFCDHCSTAFIPTRPLPTQQQLPQPDGQLLLGGQLTEGGHYALSLFSATGVPDHSFDPDLNWRGTIRTALPLTSGKLILSGTYTSLGGQAADGEYGRFQRLHADGTLNQNLPVPAGLGQFRNVLPNPDERPYVAGYTTKCLSGSCSTGEGTTLTTYRLCRMAADNTLDAGFTPIELGSVRRSNGLRSVAPPVQFVLSYPNGDLLVAGLRIVPVRLLLARYLSSGAGPLAGLAPGLHVARLIMERPRGGPAGVGPAFEKRPLSYAP